MKVPSKLFSILALTATALLPLATWADTYDSATLVYITPPSAEDARILYDSQVDILGVYDGRIKALLTDDQLQSLSHQGFHIEILYAEMREDRARWAEANASYGFVPSYYTPSTFNTTNPPAGTLMEHLLQQHNAHPDITRLYNLGASQDGAYDIIAMKVSKSPDSVEPEPKIRLYANIHGDERGGVMVTCDVLDTILAGYTAAPQDAIAKRLVDETEMWFIPIGNPYGNANSTRYNSRGIDLNRNFWGPAGSGSPPAWSEKETQAIRDLTETATADHAKKRFTVSISFHEGEIVFNSVWNYTTSAPTDEPIFWSSRTGGTGCGAQSVPNCPTLAPNGLAQAYKDGCTKPGFWYTEGYDWYVTKGDTNDWAYGAWTDLDTTVELNTTKTPSPSEIPTYCAQHRQAVLNYMMKVFQGIHGVMTSQTTGTPLDGTVTATATVSSTIPVPRTYQSVYTDPVAGDFHRLLQPGTYTVVCSAPGYVSATIPGVVVSADTSTIVPCALNRTLLKYSASTRTDSCASDGTYSGDGVVDAGEDAVLRVTAFNPGSVAATSVQGSLSTAMPGISITQGTASFSNVAAGGSGSTIAPYFRFSVDPGVACGTAIPFDIHMTAAQGAWDDSFTATVGQVTNLAPQSVVTESFDGTTFPPSGWSQVDVDGTVGNWARSTTTVHPTGGVPHSGAGLAYFNAYASSTGTSTRLYRTAGFAIPASAASASLTFWMYHDANSSLAPDRIQVQVSTNGSTWTDVGTAISRYDGSTGWRQHTISLSAFIGRSSVQVGFLGVGGVGNDCHLDDVQVVYTPTTCAMHVCASLAADLAATASAPSSAATNEIIFELLGVTNNGPGAAADVQLQTSTPTAATFVSMSAPPGWSCSTPAAGATGAVSCTAAALAAATTADFTMAVKLDWCAGNGTAIAVSATASSATSDANAANNSASASTTAVDDGSCDDGNDCTLADGCQAGACVGTAIGAPAEVPDQRFLTATTASWDPPVASGGPAPTYDVARGSLGEWPAGSGGSEVCERQQYGGNEVTLAGVPNPDNGYWYLVRARNACGIGTYGAATDGAARLVSACP